MYSELTNYNIHFSLNYAGDDYIGFCLAETTPWWIKAKWGISDETYRVLILHFVRLMTKTIVSSKKKSAETAKCRHLLVYAPQINDIFGIITVYHLEEGSAP